MAHTIMWLLLVATFTSMAISAKGFSINLIPIDSIESSLFPKYLTLEERHERLIQLSESHDRLFTGDPVADEVPRPPIYRVFSNFYVVQVYIGSGGFAPYLMLDTGSVETWVQGAGCKRCFEVRGGNYDMQVSSSSARLPCEHPLCVPKTCLAGNCLYQIRYGVNGTSHTSGWVVTDTIGFLTNTTGIVQYFRNVAFGYGVYNSVNFGLNRGENNSIAGIFGLGRGPRSVLVQLDSHTHGVFGYCLSSASLSQRVHTLLRFGEDARIRGGDVQTVDLIPDELGLYRVQLVDISVAEKRLGIEPELLMNGITIDTGAPMSKLTAEVYNRLRDAMVLYFRENDNWEPLTREPGTWYELCYGTNLTSASKVPTVTFHLQGASSFVIDHVSLFQQFASCFCMTMLPRPGPSRNLLGAAQQANYQFLFDVPASKMSFVSVNCLDLNT